MRRENPAPEWKPRWYLLKNGWWYCNINKNASTAIKEHKVDNKFHPIKPEKSFAVIRHPCDRLVSCFADRYEGWTWEKFLDYVLHEPDKTIDSHCRPQYLHLSPMPAKLVSFDHLREELAAMGLEMKVRNASKHKPWQSYFKPQQIRSIRARYREDFELWDAL